MHHCFFQKIQKYKHRCLVLRFIKSQLPRKYCDFCLALWDLYMTLKYWLHKIKDEWFGYATVQKIIVTAGDTKCSTQPTASFLVMNIKISFATVFALIVCITQSYVCKRLTGFKSSWRRSVYIIFYST